MKPKTHKGTSKRVTVSKTGKLKRRRSGARHLKSKKSGRRKRHLRSASVAKGVTAKLMKGKT